MSVAGLQSSQTLNIQQLNQYVQQKYLYIKQLLSRIYLLYRIKKQIHKMVFQYNR